MSNLSHRPDATSAPYNPDLSPWFRDPTNLIVPLEGWFVLPENCGTRPSDGYIQSSYGGWYTGGPYHHKPTVREDAEQHQPISAYARRIKDDPTLHARMQGWAKGHLDGVYWTWKNEDGNWVSTNVSKLPARPPAPPSNDYTAASQDESANPANFITVVNNRALSNAVEQLALAHGLSWTYVVNESIRREPHTIFFKRDLAATPGMLQSNARTGISVSGPTDVSWGLPRYDAATQFGEIVRLLTTPVKPSAPKVPELYGYKMAYTKNHNTVVFGCAKISLPQLRAAFTNEYVGVNRTFASVTFYSGKTITREQAKEILAYVEWADSK